MKLNRLDLLRESYYNAIVDIRPIEEVRKILPKPEFQNFPKLMEGIICKIETDLGAANDLKDSDQDSYISNLIVYYNQVIEICRENINKYNEIYDGIEVIDENKKINIIFGINANGNIPALKDMNKIDKNHYRVLLGVLEDLENGIGAFDVTKQKHLGTYNEKLKGVFEQKGYQVRVFFRKLPGNTIYIEMIRIKKDTKETLDYIEPIERTKKLKNDSKTLTQKIKNKEDVTDRFIEHERLFKELKESLQPNIKEME